jgi:hypothetical protein
MSTGDPFIDYLLRQDWRRRLFPADAACVVCGERDVEALVRGLFPTRCYECRLASLGRARTERNHLGRHPSNLVLRLPANLHRRLSSLQDLFQDCGVEPGSRAAIILDVLTIWMLLRRRDQDDASGTQA